MNLACRVCEGAADPFGTARVLGRHEVQYFRCATCGFVQTEPPYWLAEAYQAALSGLDVGAVSRNLHLAPIVQALISKFFSPLGRFIDYGGGSGLFVRLMRDAGFEFRWMDKFATNSFARGFEAGPGDFEVLTAFEVFEHLEQPAVEVARMLAFSKNLLFTTVLLPDNSPRPGEWWYYGLEHGQHIAFYTRRALQALADRFKLHLCSAGELHLLTAAPIKQSQFAFCTKRGVVRWINRFSARKSLIDADYQRLRSLNCNDPVENHE